MRPLLPRLAHKPQQPGPVHQQLFAACDSITHLAAVGILATVGHTQDACPRVPQLWVQFVLKFATIYTLTTPACASGVATLDDEVPDDPVELQSSNTCRESC